jgi:hypothetical protein
MFHLLAKVVPLHINSARSAIQAWMPECTARGVKETWEMPELEQEMEWASNLMEVASREETDLVKGTIEEEQAYIASRIVKARRAEAKGAAGAEDDEEEEVEEGDEEELAEVRKEELGGGEVAGTEAVGEPEEGELEEEGPQVPKPRRRLRTRATLELMATPPSRATPAGKKMTSKSDRQEIVHRQSARVSKSKPLSSQQKVVEGHEVLQPENSSPPPIKRAKKSPPPTKYDMNVLLESDEE